MYLMKGIGVIIGLGLLSLPASIYGDITIEPVQLNDRSRSAFYMQIDPGASQRDEFRVTNVTNSEQRARISPRNIIFGDDDVLTIEPEIAEGSAASWVSVEQTDVVLGGDTSVQIPFNVDVPENTTSQEYLVGIISESDVRSGDTLRIRNQVGSRVYIMVGEDFELPVNVDNFELLAPGNETFDELVKDDLVTTRNLEFEFDASNNGNIFGLLEGEYTLSSPGGQVLTSSFSKVLSPGASLENIRVQTNQEYTPGKTTIAVSYSVKPLNELLTDDSLVANGSFEDEYDISQAVFNEIPKGGEIDEQLEGDVAEVKFVPLLTVSLLIAVVISSLIVFRKKVIGLLAKLSKKEDPQN